MKGKIALITILTDDVKRMVDFYHSALGFSMKGDIDQYVEFEHPGVRFAICASSILEGVTGDPRFHLPRSGQAFELAFPFDSPDEVDAAYEEILLKGATPIQPPADMGWNQRTAFFADPDGNIHELFADLR